MTNPSRCFARGDFNVYAKPMIAVVHHNDLDGIAGAAACVLAHADEVVTTVEASYDNVDAKLVKLLENQVTPYTRIIVVDICPEAPTAYTTYKGDAHYKMVNETMPKAIDAYTGRGGQLVVLDHHGARTQACANKYGEFLHADSIMESKDVTGTPRAGSELAGRYYSSVRNPGDHPALNLAVRDWMRLCGAYDCWRKGPDFDFGANLAMALSLMDDNDLALRTMLRIIEDAAFAIRMEKDLGVTGFKGWNDLLSVTLLGEYAKLAKLKFAAVVAEARSSAIVHSPKLTEIYVDFFGSLVSEVFYAENQGVVAMRYTPNRDEAKKLSFRRHADFDVHLGDVLTPLGGGGHPPAAGVSWKDNPKLNADAVIAHMLLQLHPPIPAEA